MTRGAWSQTASLLVTATALLAGCAASEEPGFDEPVDRAEAYDAEPAPREGSGWRVTAATPERTARANGFDSAYADDDLAASGGAVAIGGARTTRAPARTTRAPARTTRTREGEARDRGELKYKTSGYELVPGHCGAEPVPTYELDWSDDRQLGDDWTPEPDVELKVDLPPPPPTEPEAPDGVPERGQPVHVGPSR